MFCVNKKILLSGSILVLVVFFILIILSVAPGTKPSPLSAPTAGKAGQQKRSKIGLPVNGLSLSRTGSQTVPSRQLNNDQIATLLLHWADNTRTLKGSYASGEDCDREGICQPLVTNNSAGTVAMWARFQYYLQHKNSDAIELLHDDIATYTDPAKVATIQPYFWSCKLIYQLWSSPVFSPEEKDGLQVICARSIYNEIGLAPKSASPAAQEVAALIRGNLAGDKTGEFFGTPPDAGRLDEYAINASERAGMYQWAKDPTDLKQASLYFVAAMETLSRTADTGVAADEAPLVGLAALDLDAIMPMTELPTYASTVYSRYLGQPCSTLQSCVMRAYFYNELFKREKKDEYKNERDRILSDLYETRFDYQGTEGHFAGKQAFYDHGLNYSYDMIPNMMLSGLLLDIDQ